MTEVLQLALGQLGHYPDPQYGDLCRALGDYHGLAADWVLPGNGAAELLTWAARDMAESPGLRGCHVLTPAFSDYGRALESFQVPLRPWPLPLGDRSGQSHPETANSWPDPSWPDPSWPEPEAACLLINNPHNPTGRLLSVSSLEPLLDRFALVVVDEAFMDFLPPDRQQSLIGHLDRYANLVVLRSLTKFYTLPGLRIGYALGHPDRLRRWQGWRDPWPVNALAAAAAIAAVQDNAFQARTWQWLPPARKDLFNGLHGIAGLAPLAGAANYLLVKTALPAPILQERLLKGHRVLIRDCLSFAELGHRYFRVAVRSSAENERLLTALKAAVAV